MKEDTSIFVSRSVTVVSVIAAIAGIVALGFMFGPAGIVVAIIVIVAVPLGVHFYHQWEYKEKEHLDLSAIDSITFRYANRGDIEKIVNLDEASFDENEIIGAQTFEDWHEKNPRVFSCLVQGEDLIGYFSILPLHPDTLRRFVDGEISEKDFTASDILTIRASSQCADLYFFSIAIAREHRKLLRSMFEEIARALHEKQRGKRLRRVYATAATDAGFRLIKRFKFTHVQDASSRVDGHDLYVKNLVQINDHRDYMKSHLDR